MHAEIRKVYVWSDPEKRIADVSHWLLIRAIITYIYFLDDEGQYWFYNDWYIFAEKLSFDR